METPLYKKMSCWKGYEPKGKKKSPSGKKTASGKTKMVNNCVKKYGITHWAYHTQNSCNQERALVLRALF